MIQRLWVNEHRTVLVTQWADGTTTLATREDPEGVWGAPVPLVEEHAWAGATP